MYTYTSPTNTKKKIHTPKIAPKRAPYIHLSETFLIIYRSLLIIYRALLSVWAVYFIGMFAHTERKKGKFHFDLDFYRE